jgi:hypothetical protein
MLSQISLPTPPSRSQGSRTSTVSPGLSATRTPQAKKIARQPLVFFCKKEAFGGGSGSARLQGHTPGNLASGNAEQPLRLPPQRLVGHERHIRQLVKLAHLPGGQMFPVKWAVVFRERERPVQALKLPRSERFSAEPFTKIVFKGRQYHEDANLPPQRCKQYINSLLLQKYSIRLSQRKEKTNNFFFHKI